MHLTTNICRYICLCDCMAVCSQCSTTARMNDGISLVKYLNGRLHNGTIWMQYVYLDLFLAAKWTFCFELQSMWPNNFGFHFWRRIRSMCKLYVMRAKTAVHGIFGQLFILVIKYICLHDVCNSIKIMSDDVINRLDIHTHSSDEYAYHLNRNRMV